MGRVSSRVLSRVSGFFDKTQTRFGFFFLNPYPTLFLIRPGKTRPIRVGPGRVPAGQAKIAIPNIGLDLLTLLLSFLFIYSLYWVWPYFILKIIFLFRPSLGPYLCIFFSLALWNMAWLLSLCSYSNPSLGAFSGFSPHGLLDTTLQK